MHYFDSASTTPLSSKALVEYGRCALLYTANPSSVHRCGLQAKEHLEKCRLTVSELLNTQASEIYFTSGGTEANSIILLSLLNSITPGEIIVSGIEHSSISECNRILTQHGWKFTQLKCPGGYLSPETLQKALNPNVRMVCFMMVNNVIGTVFDTEVLVKTVRTYQAQTGRKIHIHCDCVQALGKINFNLNAVDIDSASFSSHKFCGPRGVGILFNKDKAISALSVAGGQENNLRGGTENLAAISAMTCALKDAFENLNQEYSRILKLRRLVEQTAKDCSLKSLSPSSDSSSSYSPYILLLSVDSVPSEVFVRLMSDKGFCLSSGSACNSNQRTKAEKILQEMNFSVSERRGAFRVSFCCINTEEETQLLCKAIKETVTELKNGHN